MSFADPFSSRFEVFGREHKHTVDGINHQAFEKLKRLLDVGEGGDGRVVLLRAPRAGFGKTSVLQRLAGEFKESHQFVRVNLVSGRTTDAAHVLEYVLQALCEVLPGSSTLTKLDHLARRILALGLEPLVSSGEVPCQDREGALLALREQPTETFDFHHDRAVTAHWTKSNFEILGPRLAAELARVSGASLREASYWVELLFRFATTSPDNVERARLLFETVFRSDLQNQSESAAEERLHGLLSLFGTVTNLVLIVDDTEGLSTSPSDALALASFLTNLSQCCPGTLVLLSVNDDIWESAFLPILPGGLADRLMEYDVRLLPLSDDEARAMVMERAGNRAEEVFEKMDWGSGDLYARRVLKAASEAWEQLDHDTSSPLEVGDEPGEDQAALSDEDEDNLEDWPDLEAREGVGIEDAVPPSAEGGPSFLAEEHLQPEETSEESAVIDQVSAADSIESPSAISEGAKEPKLEAELFVVAEDLDEATPSAGGELEVAGAEAGEERDDADHSSGEAAAEERSKPAELPSAEDASAGESQEQAPIASDWKNAASASQELRGEAGLGGDAMSEAKESESDLPTPAASPFSAGTPAPNTDPSPKGNPIAARGEGASTPGGAPDSAPAEANSFQAADNGVLKSIFASEDRASEPESKEPIASREEVNPFLAEKPSSEVTPKATESQPAADLPESPPLETDAFAPPPPLESSLPPSPFHGEAKEFAPPPPLDLNPSTPAAIDPELLRQVSEDLSAPLQGDQSPPPLGSTTGNDSSPSPSETTADEEYAVPPSPFASLSRGAASIEKNLGEVSSIFAPLRPAGEDPQDPGPFKPLLESESESESERAEEPISQSPSSVFTAGAPPADPPELAIPSNGAGESFLTKENEPTAAQSPAVSAPATPSADPVDTPFKPVMLAPNDDPAASPFAKGEPVALTQRTELPPRKELEAPGSDSPLDGSPFEAGTPASFQGPSVSTPAAPSGGRETTFDAGESSPFAAVGGPPTEWPVNLARIDPAPPEPAISAPTPVTSGGDSTDQDKVDELLRQFKERYGRK